LAASAITRSKVTIKNLDYSLVQGDKAIVGILKQTGVNGKVCSDRVEIEGRGQPLKAIDLNAKDTPDLVPVCAALACYANGISRIGGAQRLKLKESDRLQSLHLELRKMGADIVVNEDSLTVKGPCRLHGAEVDPHNDHRIAMACAVAALGAEGKTVIDNAECVKKSYPTFFIDLRRLGADLVGGEFDR
jgi:3-phosphoshikimate 1-carboxyvinyltransferase